MELQTNQTIPWSVLELTGLLEDEDSHVHFVKMTKHLALHPYHLNNVQQGLNQIFKSLLHTYDRELKGFVLTFKNPKLVSNLTEVRFDSPFIHIDVDTEFYLFRPLVGSYVKGIVNKKGSDYIVVLVHKMYTISVPKPDDAEEWLGDSIEVGQEIRCCINHIDYMCRPPFICATLQSDYSQGCRININNVYEMSNGIENNSESCGTSQFDCSQERKININDYVAVNHNTMNNAEDEVENVTNVKIKVEEMSTEDEALSDREQYSPRKKKKRHKFDEDASIDKSEVVVKSEHDEAFSDRKQKKREKCRKSNEDVIEDENILKSEHDKVHLDGEERDSQRKKRKRNCKSEVEDVSEDKSENIVKSEYDKVLLSDGERDSQRKKRKRNRKSNEDVCKDENECSVKSEYDEAVSDRERKKRKRSRRESDEDVIEDESKNIVKSEHDKVLLSDGERDSHRKKQKRNCKSEVEDVSEDKSESIVKSECNKVISDRQQNGHQKKQKRSRERSMRTFEDESENTVKSEHPSNEINNVKIKQEKFSEVED